MRLDDAHITAKCVEVNKCLLSFQNQLNRFELQNTTTIGESARLAVCIKNVSEKITPQMLGGVSSALNIDYRLTISHILPIYEELGWIRVNRIGKNLVDIIEQFPPTQDILAELGKKWKEAPTIIDEATVNSVNLVSVKPYSKDALVSELVVDEENFNIVFDYGEQAGYLGKFISSNKPAETIWTPYYWTTNHESVCEFIEKQNEGQYDEIGRITESLRRSQGIPRETLNTQHNILDGGIHIGFFPSVKVKNRMGQSSTYVFSAVPHFGSEPDKDIFEKARQIVACIRHGQYHAEYSRILYPRKILGAMRNNNMNPHPYSKVQYAILATHGIVRLRETVNPYGLASYTVEWINTQENNLAADIADQLLSGQETFIDSNEELEARKVLLQGTYHYSSEQRRLKSSREIIAKEPYNRIMEYMSGVRL